VAPDTWATAGSDQNKVKQSASARHVSKPTAVSNLFSIIVFSIIVSIIVVALVSWFGSNCVPHPAKGFPPSQKKDFLGGDNLRCIGALTQYSMCPIGNISASLRLSLKTGKIRFSLSNFDLAGERRYTPTLTHG
jgi:hypothetical protein